MTENILLALLIMPFWAIIAFEVFCAYKDKGAVYVFRWLVALNFIAVVAAFSCYYLQEFLENSANNIPFNLNLAGLPSKEYVINKLIIIMAIEVALLHPLVIYKRKTIKKRKDELKGNIVWGKIIKILSSNKGNFITVRDQLGENVKLKISNFQLPTINEIVLVFQGEVVTKLNGVVKREDNSIFFTPNGFKNRIRIFNTVDGGLSGFNNETPCEIVAEDASLFLIYKDKEDEYKYCIQI